MIIRLSLLGFVIPFLLFFTDVQARVGIGSGDQEWGYAEVRPGANMFWWLYYTTNEKIASFQSTPLLIWLQGGPGASSTGYGNFEELGPCDINMNPRNYTWVKDYNVLFIDNPVGTGFSYVEGFNQFAKTNEQIAKDLVELMRNFYKKMPKFTQVPVYIVSESYGGKMAAEFALQWSKAQSAGTIESDLRGVGLGDSWISPIDSVLTYGPYLLQTGMVDTRGFELIQAAALRTKQAVDAGRWELATQLWAETENVIFDVTKSIDFYNILTKMHGGSLRNQEPRYQSELAKSSDRALSAFMNSYVKHTLNLNKDWGTQSGKVFSMLTKDFMKPVTHVVERLLNETDLRVFVYNGQLDLIVDTPGTLLWAERMKWSQKSSNSQKWLSSPRKQLVVDNIVEGYHKSHGNFAFYWVNRAGHMVPSDNPMAMDAILRDLTTGLKTN